jgi:hypothetical protein
MVSGFVRGGGGGSCTGSACAQRHEPLLVLLQWPRRLPHDLHRDEGKEKVPNGKSAVLIGLITALIFLKREEIATDDPQFLMHAH